VLNRRSFAKAAAFPLLAPLARPQMPVGKVKITGFEIHKVSLRWRDLLFVEVKTDAGLTGLGEATLESRTDIAESVLRWLEPEYVGQDPAGPERHWNRVYYVATRWRNGPALMTGLSAIDMALWDIEAKRLGVPLHRLLGGPIQEDQRVYFTHWDASIPPEKRDVASLKDLAQETLAKGWTAVKYTVPQGGGEMERMDRNVAELAALRNVFSNKVDIGLECAETFSVRSAIQFANAVAPYRPMFLEEPTWRENPAGLGEVAAKSPVPIATGEGLFSRFEFRQLLEAKGAAIVQPDVMHAGGVTELRKIGNLAETYGAEIAPHSCSGPIAHLASLAAMSVCRNCVIHEWEAADDAVYVEMTYGGYPVQKNGRVKLPGKPGIGIDVDFAEFRKKHPYTEVRRRAQVKF
jgi:galactonate dehydratase